MPWQSALGSPAIAIDSGAAAYCNLQYCWNTGGRQSAAETAAATVLFAVPVAGYHQELLTGPGLQCVWRGWPPQGMCEGVLCGPRPCLMCTMLLCMQHQCLMIPSKADAHCWQACACIKCMGAV